MVDYKAFHISTKGTGNQTPLKEYSAAQTAGNAQIAVIASGLEENLCFRSHLGAKFALEVALQAGKTFAEEMRADRLFRDEIGRAHV